jgi:hypothetical protein
VSSRLVYAPNGRPLYVEITSPTRELEHGLRFAVLGTEISMTSGRVQWTGEPTGRAPSLEDAAAALMRTGTHALEHRAWTDADRGTAWLDRGPWSFRDEGVLALP